MSAVIEQDLRYIWHPSSQMKDYETLPPIVIKRAQGVWLELADGRQVLDAIASWWCKSLGHGHPQVTQAIERQLATFEHVILANTTHELLVNFAQELAAWTAPLTKFFFASDGACAVEIALKMSLHAQAIRGYPQRQRFLALRNGYHGDTIGTMSITDLPIYTRDYGPLLFAADFIAPPYVDSMADPVWLDASDHWQHVLPQLTALEDQLAAIVFEPIVQGAGGMRVYSADFLRRLASWARERNIYLIADEIMTGLYRTGTPLACQHADFMPDFLCLSKGLTSGSLPLSVMATHASIYDLFYADYAAGKNFLHSHTYAGNPLALAAALATLQCLGTPEMRRHISLLGQQLMTAMRWVADTTGCLQAVRHIGAIVAADLRSSSQPRIGFKVYQAAIAAGVLLRPIGDTVYWLPPLTMTQTEVDQLAERTCKAVKSSKNGLD